MELIQTNQTNVLLQLLRVYCTAVCVLLQMFITNQNWKDKVKFLHIRRKRLNLITMKHATAFDAINAKTFSERQINTCVR